MGAEPPRAVMQSIEMSCLHQGLYAKDQQSMLGSSL